ncbi:hypothetical protein FJ948_29310, partial [Mesorhizobium sp. B2-3-12]
MRGVPAWQYRLSSRGRVADYQRLTPLEHPSIVSALRADPPSPTRVFGPETSRTGVRGHREQFCAFCARGF